MISGHLAAPAASIDPDLSTYPAGSKDNARGDSDDEPAGITHRGLGDRSSRAPLQSSAPAGDVAARLEFDHEGLVALVPAPNGSQHVACLAVRDWNRHHALPSRIYTAFFTVAAPKTAVDGLLKPATISCHLGPQVLCHLTDAGLTVANTHESEMKPR